MKFIHSLFQGHAELVTAREAREEYGRRIQDQGEDPEVTPEYQRLDEDATDAWNNAGPLARYFR